MGLVFVCHESWAQMHQRFQFYFFFSLSFDKKSNPRQLHIDWYVPETSCLQVPPIPLLGKTWSLCWTHATNFHANHLWGLFGIYTNRSSNIAIFLHSRPLEMLGWLVAQVDVRVKYVILWNQYIVKNYIGETNV